MNKKLHILFLNSWYPSRVLPNNGDFIQRHAEAVSLNHQVTSIHVITDPNLKESTKIIDKTIHNVRTIIGYIKPTKNLIKKLYLYFKTYLMLYKMAGKINLVHLNVIYPAGIFALYLKWFKKKPYIISEHWSIYKEIFNVSLHPFIRFLFKIIGRNSTFIAPVSNDLKNLMIQNGIKGNYYPVPNVVNTNLFKPNNSKPNEFIIMHASNMADVKNVPAILNVIKKLELIPFNFTFYLVGENVNKYHQLIKELQLNKIKLINQLDHNDFSKLINKVSVLILFSKSENLPCVVLEAFSCGVPVISSNVGGIKEYFPANFGKLISLDENQLLNAIIEIKDHFNKASNDEMHNYVVKHFSYEVVGNQFSILYHKSI